MDEIIEILTRAAKQGLMTGGADKDGNYAYVVMDGTDPITITIRPSGRATILRGKEEPLDFDIDASDSSGAVEFVTALGKQLIADNLDHKAVQLGDIASDYANEDTESDEDSEDTESDEDVDTDTEDSEASDDDADGDSEDEDVNGDDEDVEDEEQEDPDHEEAAVTVSAFDAKKAMRMAMGDDDFDEVAAEETLVENEVAFVEDENDLTSDELALMIDHMPAIVDSMIETAVGGPKSFSPLSFMASVASITNYKAPGDSPPSSMAVNAGMSLTINVAANMDVSVVVNNVFKRKISKGIGSRAANLIDNYVDYVVTFGRVNRNKNKYRKLIDDLEEISAAIRSGTSSIDTGKKVLATCTDILSSYRNIVANTTGHKFDINLGVARYSIGYRYDSGKRIYVANVSYSDYIGNTRKLMETPCEYSVTAGAAIAKLASMLVSGVYTNALLPGVADKTMANRFMRLAVKLGYGGESDNKTALKVAQAGGKIS